MPKFITRKLVFTPPNFPKHTQPLGLLPPRAEYQALWYYFILASEGWKKDSENMVYEGEKDHTTNFEQLFRNCAAMYNCDIDTLANYWPMIDAELERYNLTLPEGTKISPLPHHLRFTNKVVIVKPHGRIH